MAKQQMTIVVFAVLWVETRSLDGGGLEGGGETSTPRSTLLSSPSRACVADKLTSLLALVCAAWKGICLRVSSPPAPATPSPVAATLVFDRPHFLSFLFHLFSVFFSHCALFIFHEPLSDTHTHVAYKPHSHRWGFTVMCERGYTVDPQISNLIENNILEAL